jgi:hypothetical protein
LKLWIITNGGCSDASRFPSRLSDSTIAERSPAMFPDDLRLAGDPPRRRHGDRPGAIAAIDR